jgi:hypothetical protein
MPVTWRPAAGGGSPAGDGGRSTEGAHGKRDVSGVLGVRESRSAPPRLSGLGASGSSSALHALLAFLAVLLALLIGAVLATRRSGVPPMLLVRRFRRPPKPLLFLDVDGVISLRPRDISAKPPGVPHDVAGFRIYIAEDTAELLRVLSTRFDLVWASGWEGEANHYLRDLLALDRDLPALRFEPPSPGWPDRSIERVSRAAGRRPVAWIDDDFGPAHDYWARTRGAPTKLVPTASPSGLRRRHVDELISWAEELERGSVERARSRSGS